MLKDMMQTPPGLRTRKISAKTSSGFWRYWTLKSEGGGTCYVCERIRDIVPAGPMARRPCLAGAYLTQQITASTDWSGSDHPDGALFRSRTKKLSSRSFRESCAPPPAKTRVSHLLPVSAGLSNAIETNIKRHLSLSPPLQCGGLSPPGHSSRGQSPSRTAHRQEGG